MSPETVRFLLSLDMKLLEVTSMTEMGGLPQLMNTINPGEFRVGKVGLEFPELSDVKLVNKDEVSIVILRRDDGHMRRMHANDFELNFFTDWSW